MRGFNADFIILDEANFIKLRTIKEAIFPVAQQDYTIFIGLTTPQGQDNEVTRLFNTKDKEGNVIITAIRIGKPCDACREKQILCTHVENATAEGLSRKKRQLFQCFYEGEMHIAMREFTGETSDDSRILFEQKWLLSLLRRHVYPTRAPLDFLMVSIDPAQGGTCEWGFCACYYDSTRNTQVIVQLDAERIQPATPSNVTHWLFTSLNSLRSRHPAFSRIPIVIACESAPKAMCETIAEYVQQMNNAGNFQNVHLMTETPENRPGVLKTETNTQDMVRYTRQLLENNQVFFADTFGTSLLGQSEEDAKKHLLSQLTNFKIRFEETNRPDGVRKARMDGKTGGRNDDLAVAYIMNVYWYFMFMMSTKAEYVEIRKQSRHWRSRHVAIEAKSFLAPLPTADQLADTDELFDENGEFNDSDDDEGIDADDDMYTVSNPPMLFSQHRVPPPFVYTMHSAPSPPPPPAPAPTPTVARRATFDRFGYPIPDS